MKKINYLPGTASHGLDMMGIDGESTYYINCKMHSLDNRRLAYTNDLISSIDNRGMYFLISSGEKSPDFNIFFAVSISAFITAFSVILLISGSIISNYAWHILASPFSSSTIS